MFFNSCFKKGHLESAFTTITRHFLLTPIRMLHFLQNIFKTSIQPQIKCYSLTIVVSITTVEAAK